MGVFVLAGLFEFKEGSEWLSRSLLQFAKLFFRDWKSERSVSQVAARFDLSKRTVRRLFRRFEELGEAGIPNGYRQCGNQLDTDWKQRAAQLRQEHPNWGAEMIRLCLQEQHPTEQVPSARTMQRWLKELELNPAAPGRRVHEPRAAKRLPRAEEPHQAWQIDAAECMKLKCNCCVCWLRIVDECSGAFLKTTVYSHARWEHVDRFAIRNTLRKAFSRWGLPDRIQVDNGYPWGSTGGFPPEMSLWVMGLGIDMVWSRPSCPQENGVVERSQGTGKRWAEPETCNSPAELQQRLDRLDRLQRERYPYHGSTRREVFPELKHSGHEYTCRGERKMWRLAPVLEALSERVAIHRVDRHGGISIYHYSRYVGKQHAGQQVYITLDPSGPRWVCASREGVQWCTHDARELTKARILALNVGCRKGSKKGT